MSLEQAKDLQRQQDVHLEEINIVFWRSLSSLDRFETVQFGQNHKRASHQATRVIFHVF